MWVRDVVKVTMLCGKWFSLQITNTLVQPPHLLNSCCFMSGPPSMARATTMWVVGKTDNIESYCE
jgi:hypothetical protein